MNANNNNNNNINNIELGNWFFASAINGKIVIEVNDEYSVELDDSKMEALVALWNKMKGN